MRRAFAILPVFLLLAGCIANADAPSPSATQESDAPEDEPRRLGLGEHAMEPHVAVRAVAGEGTRIVVANMADVRLGPGKNPITQIELHRSLDGGTTWTSALFDPSVLAPHDPLGVMGFSGDSVLAYAPDGALYLAGVAAMGPIETIPLLGPCCLISSLSVFLTRSLDDGATWSAPLFWRGGLGPAPVGTMQDKEWVTVGPDGTIHFGWTEFTSFPLTTLRYVRSLDGGATWTEPATFARTAAPGDDLYQALTLAAPGGNRVYATWLTLPSTSSNPVGTQVASVSRDNGATWSPPVPLAPAQFPRFAHLCASAQDPLRAHVVVADGQQRMNVVTTRDGGATWSVPAPLNARPGPQPLAACHADASGLRVVHYDTSWPGGEHAVLARLTAEGILVSERALSGPIDPAERRREYLGIAGDGAAVWAAWVAGSAASQTWIEAARAVG